jgi:hypothetical protein
MRSGLPGKSLVLIKSLQHKMDNQPAEKLSKGYLISLLLTMLILPLGSVFIDYIPYPGTPFMLLVGKWFVFWAIGVRLLAAGIRQSTKPLFTLQQIFRIQNPEGRVIVKELGFANICFGLTGIIALFIADWRPAAAFAGGLYMGIAGFYHVIKKPSSPNEVLAMVSDIYIFVMMAAYLGWCIVG